MGKRLPTISGKQCVQALAKVGFKLIPGRGKGSHMFVYREEPPTGITIPEQRELSRGLLRAIIRQAGLTVDEFIALL